MNWALWESAAYDFPADRPGLRDFQRQNILANFYQASIYAWNAFREDRTITSVKYDTKKGLYTITA